MCSIIDRKVLRSNLPLIRKVASDTHQFYLLPIGYAIRQRTQRRLMLPAECRRFLSFPCARLDLCCRSAPPAVGALQDSPSGVMSSQPASLPKRQSTRQRVKSTFQRRWEITFGRHTARWHPKSIINLVEKEGKPVLFLVTLGVLGELEVRVHETNSSDINCVV